MKIVIVGGSGFIGSTLSQVFVRQGHSVVSVDIHPPRVTGVAFAPVSKPSEITPLALMSHPDVVINLAGHPIVGAWNTQHKQIMYSSRILTTRSLVSIFKQKEFRPRLFIQASAVGVYGDQGEATLSEGSRTENNTFLAHLAHDWEKEASLAVKQDIRTVIVRQANVLGREGLLKKLYPFYKRGIGGSIGSGRFWFPWIHSDDLARVYSAVISHEHFSGIINAVAPEVLRYKFFSQTIARITGCVPWIRIPYFVFHLLYRGFAREITASQKVVSLRLWELGDIIHYKNIESALRDILATWKKEVKK